MPTSNKKDTVNKFVIGALILGGLAIGYFITRPKKVVKPPFVIPPATNLYPESEQLRMAQIDKDYREKEKYISWEVANIHPSYQEYLKHWYGYF